VAQRVASEIGFAYLDTGAMYRAVTLRAILLDADMTDGEALARIARDAAIELDWTGTDTHVCLDGTDVTEEIRSPEVTAQIFRVDEVPAVRDELVARQQAFGADGRVVAEGRDIGTVVFPRARCKVFMEASLDERARRRYTELVAKGVTAELHEVRRAIADRDRKTMSRAAAPLRAADDAVCLDTTELTLQQVVETVVAVARDRGVTW